jgi:hypothetical protein
MINWVKAGAVGALGSLIIFIVMMVGIHVTGMAPFNLPPSAAFLEVLGMNIGPLPLIAHFGYGIAWALILLAVFGEKTDIWRGIGVSVIVQWLVLMQLVYSPIIGWGVFGTNAGTLPADNPLALNAMVPYIVMTLVLHLVYGALNGWLIPLWTGIGRKG